MILHSYPFHVIFISGLGQIEGIGEKREYDIKQIEGTVKEEIIVLYSTGRSEITLLDMTPLSYCVLQNLHL